MTPAARISAAIEVLDQVFDGLAAEQALSRWARGARFAGSKDRAAVRDHVFQALRCRRSYAAMGGGEDGRSVMIGGLREQGVDPATLFTGEGHAPRALTGAEMVVREPEMSQADTADLPDWVWSLFQQDLGQDAMAQAVVLRGRAPIALRVNHRMKTTQQAIEMLSVDGVEASPVPGCDTALIATQGARRIRQSQAYLTGVVELQDVSSQSAMARIRLAPGARVLDYCAGGGGKTLALAAMATQDGRPTQFFAHDADPRRMVDLPARAARAGVDVTRLHSDGVGRHAPFDLVLCDVPCTGSGTWRRTPDAKWRLTQGGLDKLIEIQQDILRTACGLVGPGGRLVYTTCSILARENMDQVEAFRQAHPSAFDLEDHIQIPVSDTSDGFFFASLVRKA
ncbi:MAG: RsmB/NOP family class I SAM-dependent RNA methyltransferase [Pseudomonadota bacterium]